MNLIPRVVESPLAITSQKREPDTRFDAIVTLTAAASDKRNSHDQCFLPSVEGCAC